MGISTLYKYYDKLRRYGLRSSGAIVLHRLQTKKHIFFLKRMARIGKAHHTWHHITQMHKLSCDFDVFWQQLAPSMHHVHEHIDSIPHNIIVSTANQLLHNYGNFLGCSAITDFLPPWHSDTRLRSLSPSSDYQFAATIFYKDITIAAGTSFDLTKDVKLPWELSRCHHLVVWGQAYAQTNQLVSLNPAMLGPSFDKLRTSGGIDTATKYVQAFERHVTNWLDQNPYLFGVNWLCPMEVSIRAINWLWALQFFKNAPQLSTDFWQRIVCSLYDHFVYLQHNWEFYDGRTNNHYFSNLVGFLHLCWFFQKLPGVDNHIQWCIKELMRECAKQILPDGSCYEGSTAYHQLMTELVYHALFICKELQLDHYAELNKYYDAMRTFIAWATPYNGELITIGDNDSGKVLYWGKTIFLDTSYYAKATKDYSKRSELSGPFASPARRSTKCEVGSNTAGVYREVTSATAYFPNFGLSIYKSKKLHVTLRHHAYEWRQPSGHFHNDIGSITLAMNGIPIIVDPGSYVYTASAAWRNYFRSVAVHNTCYLEGHEPIPFDERLFALEIPESKTNFSIHTCGVTPDFALCATTGRRSERDPVHPEYAAGMYRGMYQHNLYRNMNLIAQRNLTISEHQINITDSWHPIDPNKPINEHTVCWNFTIGPTINVVSSQDGYDLKYQEKYIAHIRAAEEWYCVDGWHSPAYGVKLPCKHLCFKKSLVVHDPTHITIQL